MRAPRVTSLAPTSAPPPVSPSSPASRGFASRKRSPAHPHRTTKAVHRVSSEMLYKDRSCDGTELVARSPDSVGQEAEHSRSYSPPHLCIRCHCCGLSITESLITYFTQP